MDQNLVVFARVALPGEAVFEASNYRVEAWSGDRSLATTLSDKKGQARLDLKGTDGDGIVELRVFAPWGTEIERRTLTAKELADPRELLLRASLPPDILSPDGTGVPVPRVVRLLSQGDMDMFHAVTAIASFGDYFPQAGGPIAEVDQIYELLGELEAIYHWSYGALRGDARHIRSLKSHLSEEECSVTGHHDAPAERADDEETAKNYLTIEEADALPLAGVLLDAMETKTEANGPAWAERARCYYLCRASVIQRAFGAAESVAQGKLELEAFAAILKKVAARGSHTPDKVGDDLIVPIEQWDGATIRWARHAEKIQAIGKTEIRAGDIPLLFDRVEPAAVGEGQEGTLTLVPTDQSRFPERSKEKLDGVIALWQGGSRHLLEIDRWEESKIEVKLPRGLPAGRGAIYWEAPTPSFANRIPRPSPGPGDQDDGRARPEEWAPSPYRMPGQVELPVLIPYASMDRVGNEEVGERSVSFPDPGGLPHWETERFLTAESCTEVRISWEGGVTWSSEPLIGGIIPATVSLSTTILANGEVIQLSAPASGELVADPGVSTRYEVRVEAHIGAVSLGVMSAAFSVDRQARIRLEVADRVHPFNIPVPIIVRISCPAPAGGLSVRLTSHPALLTSATVRVPEGQSFLDTSLMAGADPGGAITATATAVTATATSHLSDTAFVHLGNTSCVPLAPRFGGEWHISTAALNVVGVHIAVLHTGKVLLFSYNEGHFPMEADRSSGQWLTDILSVADSNLGKSQLWDPITDAVTTVPLQRNLFCSGHAFLPDGRLFVAGGQFHVPVWVAPVAWLLGPALPPALATFLDLINAAAAAALAGGHNYDGADRDLQVFSPTSPVTSAWERLSPDMSVGRWYPTCVTLPSGEVMVISGTSGALSQPVFGGIQDSIEIFDPMHGTRRALIPLGFHIRHLYPFMHVLPSGRVFLHWKRRTALFDPITARFDHFPSVLTNHPFSRTGPGPGTSVLLPLIPTRDSNGQVSYPARILILGGGGAEGRPEPPEDGDPTYDLSHFTPATNSAEICEFGASGPAWRTIANMHNPRVMPDSVILPTGKILVLHGAGKGMAGAFGSHLGNLGPSRDAVLEAELFDPGTRPGTETWERLCPATIRRIYHATAALLPDGRVLVAGHDGLLNNFERDPPDADGHENEPNTSSKYRLEIFSPPYLFRGARPVISSAPGVVEYSSAFQIEMSTDVSEVESVCIIRQSSQTHQINTDQRYVGLAIIPTLSRTSVMVQAPPDANIAPPGFYMLFVVNRRGVPSVANWLQMRSP